MNIGLKTSVIIIHFSSGGIAPRSPPIEFASPYAVFAPTLFEFDPINTSSPLD